MEIKRVRQAEGFLMLLRHIRSQISCFCTPLGDIFGAYENAALEEIGFLSAMRERGFSAAIDECREKILLSCDEIGFLYSFGEEIGKSYREEEIECCDYYISVLEDSYARSRADQPRRARLFRSVLLTGGLMLIIVFI